MPRPRDPDIDDRVLRAAAQLLDEGDYGDLTMEAVAERAGVSKPSLYRRWPNLAHLAYEVHVRATLPDDLPDTGTFAGDVRILLAGLAREARRMDRSLLADQYAEMIRDESFARTVEVGLMAPMRDRAARVYDRAVRRGEVRGDLDAREVMRDLSSHIVLRTVLLHRPPDEEMLDDIVDRLVDGVRRR